MFKNMKLATKIAGGFGLLIAICAILGYTGVRGIKSGAKNYGLSGQGDEVNGLVLQCGLARKDFVIHGIEPYGSDNANAAENWKKTTLTMRNALEALGKSDGVDNDQQAIIGKTLETIDDYETLLEKEILIRKQKDEAFSQWGKAGEKLTAETDSVIESMKKLNDTLSAETKTKLQIELHKAVLENFFILRIRAVYLVHTEKNKDWQRYQEQLQILNQGIEHWAGIAPENKELAATAARIREYIQEYTVAGEKFHSCILELAAIEKRMAQEISTIATTIESLHLEFNAQASEIEKHTNLQMISMAIAGVVAGTILAILVTLSIVRPVKNIISSLTEGSEQVTSAAGQVASASQSLAEGATEQAAGLEETSSSLEEMTAMTRQSSDNAQQANLLAAEARKAANSGTDSMNRMNSAIHDIQQSSGQTAKIIKVIDEIAFQTNLLALNAAVEAARAGEAGKGFAVVAEEVRNLAKRSAEAAKDTASLIEESVRNAENGVDISAEVGTILQNIVESVGKTSELVNEIAASSAEQSQGIDQINMAVTQMDQVTQSNAANAEQSASAAEELSSQAGQMNDMVAELTALVGGRQLSASRPKTAKARPAPAPAINAGSTAATKAIPFDEDMAGFNG